MRSEIFGISFSNCCGHVRFLTLTFVWFSEETGESQKEDKKKKGNESCEIFSRKMFQTWEKIINIRGSED